MKVGDKVWYVPDRAHALNCSMTEGFAWSFEVAATKGRPARLLSDAEFSKVLARAKDAKAKDFWEQHRAVAPKVRLVAVVTAVAEDGTVSLDADASCWHGGTLHETGVKVDATGKAPHGCHATEDAE